VDAYLSSVPNSLSKKKQRRFKCRKGWNVKNKFCVQEMKVYFLGCSSALVLPVTSVARGLDARDGADKETEGVRRKFQPLLRMPKKTRGSKSGVETQS